MRRFYYLCLSLVLVLFACTKEIGMEENLTTNEIEVNTDGVEFAESSLTIDQAVKSMEFVQRNLDGTNHRKRSIKNVELLTTLDIKANAVTRASGDETAEQPLAYVVNFENNGGYAILAADTNLPPVIMLGDEGNFSTEEYLDFVQNNTTRSGSELTDVEDVQYTMITNSIVLPPTYPTSPRNPRDTAVMVRCLPLVPTKWGQGAPYNYYAKTEDNQTAVAGCVPVAFAQTLASLSYHHNFTPSVEIDPEYPVNWPMINAAISNGIIKYSSNDTSSEALNVASLIRAAGSNLDTKYGATKTSASVTLVATELIRLGCSSAVYEHNSKVSTDDLFTMIVRNNYPVISQASRLENDKTYAHAFVLDGWLRLEYTYSIITGTGPYIYTEDYRSQFDLVHVNFGWDGVCDGYYLPTSFDTTSSQYNDYAEENDINATNNRKYDFEIWHMIYNL